MYLNNDLALCMDPSIGTWRLPCCCWCKNSAAATIEWKMLRYILSREAGKKLYLPIEALAGLPKWLWNLLELIGGTPLIFF